MTETDSKEQKTVQDSRLVTEITDIISEALSPERLKGVIAQEVEKAVSGAVTNAFSYGSDARKYLDKMISRTMLDSLKKGNFDAYLDSLDTVLQEVIDQTVLPENKTILENFKRLAVPDKNLGIGKVVKLSDMFYSWQDLVVADKIDTSKLTVCTDDAPSYSNVSVQCTIKPEHSYYDNDDRRITVSFVCTEDSDLNYTVTLYRLYNKCIHVKEDSGIDTSKLEYSGEYMILKGFDSTFDHVMALRHINEFDAYMFKVYNSSSTIVIDIEDGTEDEVEVNAHPEATWS